MRQRAWLPLLLLAVGCATGRGPEPLETVAREDRYFLAGPLAGYPRAVGSDVRLQLERAHAELLEEGNREEAARIAGELHERNPDLAPARVLQAEIDFTAGLYRRVIQGLAEIVEEYPQYIAAQLLLGRAAEKVGESVVASQAYEAIAATNALARSRALDLASSAAGELAEEIREELARGYTGEALTKLERLESLAPEAQATLEVAVEVARARNDSPAELEALRRLRAHRPEDVSLMRRQAELELEIGDPATGMGLIEDLAAGNPDDTELQEQLARARFMWRLQLLPAEVREVAARNELTRADFALLLYWLFPEVRYGRSGEARIANDILDHPQREALVRIINAGVMDVDQSLHQFEPYRAVTRQEALTALIGLMSRQGPAPACLGGLPVPGSRQEVCAVAATCQLIDSVTDCLPGGAVSGGDAVELCRLALESAGGS